MNLKKLYINLLKFFSKDNNYIIDKTSSIRESAKILNFSNKKENIIIGKNTIIKGTLIVFAHSGKIVIGNDTYVAHNTEIWSAKEVHIGNRVQIAHNVNIIDTNGHPTDSKLRFKHFKDIVTKGFDSNINSEENKSIRSAKICIKDDAWIGIGSFITRGVTVEKEGIVGPMSYVIEDVPSRHVVMGNPAKIIKKN
jgi:acetyltransferase-like isoleucine patch superfamily enzyme